jgi:uncharacterized low-complexity protein
MFWEGIAFLCISHNQFSRRDIMADKKKIALAMVASTLVLLSNGLQANETPVEQVQEEALSYSDLGSGEEVRSNLVSQTNQSKTSPKAKQNNSRTKKTADGSCGESSCGAGGTGGTGGANGTGGTGAKKPADGQCGQGTCGAGGTGGGNTSSNQKGKKTTSAGK